MDDGRVVADGVVGGAVIAGGRSRRMGADKRLLVVDGAPLLTRAVRAVQTACAGAGGKVTVVTAAPDPAVAAIVERAEVIHDRRPDGGPLAGLEAAAHHHLDADALLVLGGDHGWADVEVLRLLVDSLLRAADAEVAVLGGDGPPQPLVAAYRPRQTHDAARSLLDAGERRLTAILGILRMVEVAPAVWRAVDEDGATLRDVDVPADLEAWP